MGEPAVMTRGERAHVLDYANRVVAAIREDAEQPQARYVDGDAMDDTAMIAMLSLLLVDTNTALLQACAALDTEGLKDTARRLRELDLEVR